MNAKTDCVVTDVVRRFARETTPEEMQARGVRKVRSVSLNRVAGVIETAIQNALMQRNLGVVDDHQEAFSEAAREEFVRLIEGGSPEPAPPEAGSALDRLKHTLRHRRMTLAESQRNLLASGGIPTEEDEALERDLRAVFVGWGGDAERLSPLEQEITRIAVLALRKERGRAEQADLDRQANEMDLLERRVAKLNKELKSSEAELARVLAMKSVDTGLQSVYGEVQGLSGEDDQFERKSELMTALFAANIELRVKLDSHEQEQECKLASKEDLLVNEGAVEARPSHPLRAVPSPEQGLAVGRASLDTSALDSGALEPDLIPAGPANRLSHLPGGPDDGAGGRWSSLWTTTPGREPVGVAEQGSVAEAQAGPDRIEAQVEMAVPVPAHPAGAKPEAKEGFSSAPSWLRRN